MKGEGLCKKCNASINSSSDGLCVKCRSDKHFSCKHYKEKQGVVSMIPYCSFYGKKVFEIAYNHFCSAGCQVKEARE